MTFYDQARGSNPQGVNTPIPVGGAAITPMTTPLGANAAANTGWIKTTGYGSLLYVIRTDKASAANGIVVEYSDDGTTALPGGGGVTYGADQLNMQIQRVLVPKGNYTRITYTNGPVAQTSFRLEVKLSTTLVQPTESSLNVPASSSNLALITKTIQEADDGTGTYDQITRTGTALNVNITNSSQTVTAIPPRPTTGAITEVNVNGSNVTLLAANANRKGAVIFSPGTLFVSLGPSCTTTLSTYRLVANSTMEVPFGYTGIITAAGSNIAVDITELV